MANEGIAGAGAVCVDGGPERGVGNTGYVSVWMVDRAIESTRYSGSKYPFFRARSSETRLNCSCNCGRLSANSTRGGQGHLGATTCRIGQTCASEGPVSASWRTCSASTSCSATETPRRCCTPNTRSANWTKGETRGFGCSLTATRIAYLAI